AQVIAERSFGAGQLAINLGNQGVPSQDLEAYTWDDQFFFRAGGAYTLTDTVGTSLELAGNVPYSGAGESGSIPVEGLLGGWLRPGARDVVVRAGVGTGITGGVGAPRIRGILAVAYEPPTGADVDDDGIVDMLDNCPTRPEDVDGDRDRDGCPEPTAVTFRFIDAVTGQRVSDVAYRIDERPHTPDESVVQVSTGSHELVAEAPNYKVSRMDLVIPGGPRQTVTVTMDALSPATVAFRVQDMDGRPLKDVTWEVDAVEQGTLDVAGIRLRLSPITYRFAAVAPGYLKRSRIVQLQPGDVLRLDIQLKATTIEVSEERIELNQKIAFEGRKETFEEASIPLLDDLATVLQEYPEIRRLRIEGHTDSRGDASANLDLSEKRAQAVMEYLISRGIEPTRLRTEGLGESRPLDTRASLLAYERNRRIELIVEEWTPQVTRTVTSPDSPLIRPATEQ
ncbi:MAG: OmpA family protein, partial [Myxococcota bacterium]